MTVSCVGPYTLQVTGFSPLDFTYQLLDVEDLERGITRRVVGNPLRGKPIKFCLQTFFLLDVLDDIAALVSSLSTYHRGVPIGKRACIKFSLASSLF